MIYPARILWCAGRLAVFFVCGIALALGAEPASEPLTYLYDAPAASAARLSGEELSNKSGWSAVEEDDTTHRFQGCSVMVNDKIVAVLNKDTPEVALYSRLGNQLKLCARLQPVCNDGAGPEADVVGHQGE